MKKINPCPNCGNRFISTWRRHKTRKYHLECTQCHWCSKQKTFLFRAIRAWNRQKKRR